MANVIAGNKISINTTGLVTAARTKIAYIFFTGDSNNDEIVLRESSDGPDILTIRDGTTTMMYDTSRRPMVFNGIYIQTLSSGGIATIITTQGNDV